MHKIKKFITIALSVAVGVTFIPAIGMSAYGEEESTQDPAGVEDIQDIEEAPAQQEENPVEEEVTNEEQVKEGEVEEPEEPVIEETQPTTPQKKEVIKTNQEEQPDFKVTDLEEAGETSIVPGECLKSFTVKMKNPKKIMHIEAAFTQTMFRTGVFIDGSDDPVRIYDNKSAISDDISMSNYSTCAVHKITLLYIFDSKAQKYSYADRNIKMSMYAKPSSKGQLAVYHNRIEYQAPVDPNLINYKLYMDYSTNGKTWKTYGPMTYVQNYTIKKGIKPNKKYKLRIYYVYNGYKGTDTGNYKYIGTYRTGVKTKVAVKSIKVKAYKVKKKKQKVYGAYTGLYLGKRTYYQYKMKIVVKLKKKPGTAGIWINGKRFKGNKKKYTIYLGTFTSYSKPKGKKYKVAMYKYHNKKYGGYSPMYIKSCKIK